MKSARWLNRFAWFTAAATLLLICSGGMVTSKGAGLAVPDWPTTFGYNMFLFPASKWLGGILFEHTHRLAASTVGILTIVLAVWLWRADDRSWVRTLGVLAVAGVILQGVLGGLRVAMLKDEIGIFHACFAQAFLALVTFIALVTSRAWHSISGSRVRQDVLRSIRTLAWLTTAVIYLQLGLGATMRHEHRDLAILDFPTAYNAWIPDTTPAALAKINAWRDAHAFSNVSAFQIWLQMAHRFGAMLVAIGVIALFVRVQRVQSESPTSISPLPANQLESVDRIDRPGSHAFRILQRLSVSWLVLVVFQLTLGAWVIWSNKAADVATAHVAVGAIMLCFGVSISAITWRMFRSAGTNWTAEKFEAARAAVM